MKKKVFSLMMMLLLAFTGFVRADELTVHDGTATNGYVPVYGFYADAYLKCEMVYPAAELAALNGGDISALKFYASQSSVSWGSANFQVFVAEVSSASISSFNGPGTVVYEGSLSISGGEMTVTFTTPYHYNGGNLLVGVYNTVEGSYVTSTWYGETVSGASVQGYSYSSLGEISATQRDFLPKTTFTYTGGGGGGGEIVEVTIGDPSSTTTNSYLPTYSLYDYSLTQQIYTADEIGVGGTINAFTMWLLNTSSYARNLNVYMKEVSESAFASGSAWVSMSTSDMVGSFTLANGFSSPIETTVSLSSPFTYTGNGNLVICVQDVTGQWSSGAAGVTLAANGNQAIYAYRDGTVYDPTTPGVTGYTLTSKNVLRLSITTGGGGGTPSFVDKLHVKYMDGEEEVIDSLNMGVRPAGCWMEPFTFTMYSEGPNYTVNVLDFTPSDGMFSVSGEELPFQVAPNADVELTLAVNTADTGLIQRQFVAITEGDRAAHIWPVVVELYQPEIPDVVELAYDLGTVTPGFTYAGAPAEITPTVLHNDYTLPFPEIPEGEDGVYMFTVENDVIISAYVGDGQENPLENGKVALYKQEGEERPHPMADNNYTGLAAAGGGGAAGAPFEAQIGEGTSTSGYFPFYSLYNYSIAAELFLAAELEEAGVTTAPFTSLSWNATNSISQNQQNITIWMANVSDTQIPATSPLASGMTKVYTGDLNQPTPTGWVEFVFNEGSFSWDGHSNVMILCQRNNGEWTSSIQWQYHNPGFQARGYDYTDNAAYDVTTTAYSWYTSSTTRANIIMKGGNRSATSTVSFNFEGGVTGWTNIDNDGDGNTWFHSSNSMSESGYDYTGLGNNASDGFMVSASYSDLTYEAIDADNYLVSPQKYTLGDNASVNFFFDYGSDAYPDYFEVCVATANNPGANDFTSIWSVDMRGNAEKTAIRHSNNRYENWREVTVDLSAYAGQDVWIAFHHEDYDQYELWIDDVTINTGGGTTPPTPPTPVEGGVSAGPVITNLGLTPGTYYLVASNAEVEEEPEMPQPRIDGGETEDNFFVYINIDEMPCPAVEAEGFAFNPEPADDADEIEPASVTLRWQVPEYATGWRLIFGSTYHPEPGHPQTIMYPEDGSFTTDMANSYTVRNLWNNTNYFWHVEFNNDACPEGVSSPIWGFTTHLNIPQNLTVVDETVFNDENIVLNWTAVVDRTYRFYNVYRDGELIGHTNTNDISNTTYTDGPLPYNMQGYTYYVTAVYDEGESAPSNTVTVKVSGRGNVNGHVYEQDGTTGIAGATVTMVGQDEFGVNHTYNFTTDSQGYYSGAVYAGPGYDGQAAKEGYQTAYVPVQGEPIVITYNQTTSPIDYIMDENFDPVCGVIAEYYPDSLDPNSPYVKVYWGCGLPGSEIIEPFETGDFSLFDWQLDSNYPWSITTTNPYEGTYCMKSGGAGVASVVSNMSVTVDIPADGLMSFFGKISCENSWDYGYFYIDGVQKASFTGAGNWVEKTYDITQGEHTFKWSYTKDSSVNSNDDCFYVDYITFYKQPEPAIPGMTYDFEDGTMQGWTSVDADGDGYGWYMGSEIMTGQTGNNGSNDFVLSQSYYLGTVLYPDNYLVSPQVQLGGVVRFYACAQDASYAAEHFGLAVSTTNTNPSSFTMVQEWTMTAKGAGEPTGKPIKGQRSGRAQGNWYEYTVDLSAYSGMGYVAIRHFNCSDMFYLNVDDITIGEPGAKGFAETRSLDHYRVYRTNCYNDGPYTEENTVLLASVWVPDTVYIDVEWADLPAGVYKWGVGAVYSGNRGEEIEGPINWAAPQAVNMTRSFGTAEANQNGPKIEMEMPDPTDNRDYLQYCTETFSGGVGTGGGAVYWGIRFPAADLAAYAGQTLTKVGVFMDIDGDYGWTYSGNYTASVYQGGATAPGTLVSTAAEYLPGDMAWHDITLTTPVTIDATQDLWLTFYTPDIAYPMSGCDYVGNANSDYLSLDGTTWEHAGDYGLDYTWMIRGTVENGGGPGPGPAPTPTNNLNQLALPRESETIWSNCLDKDMYLTNGVTVNVLLNSADSPEGVQVNFTNYNEYEQQTYGGYNVTLDESGYYAFESFRKGEYKVNVTFDGYEPIEDSVSIWEPTDLRYVMTEILYGVENIYVSRTGWAKWEDSHNNPGGGGGGGGQGGNGATSFSDDFEGGLGNWTIVDADGDGHNWYHSSQSMTYACYDYTGWGHNESNGFAVSSSYTDCTYDSYDPNNFMITNQKYSISSGSVLNFWADYGNDSYPDHFGVAVATADNPTPADFTIVWEGSAKSGNAGKSQIRHNGDRYFNWRSHSVDLSAYAGQDVYIAFRHFNSYDQYEIYIDDVELTGGAKSNDRHLEYYKVMCTSIDGVPIFNHNTVHPFCQLSTDEPYNAPLVPGEHYLCKVACMYSTGLGAWSEPVEWVYEECDHWGPVDEVEVDVNGQGNHIEWVFDHGFNPYGGDTPGPGPGTGGTFSVDFEGNTLPEGWTVIDGNNDGYTWCLTSAIPSTWTYYAGMSLDWYHNGTNAICSGSYINGVGAITPDEYLVSPQVAIANGSQLSFWVAAADASYAADHFGVFVSDNGTSNWTSVQEWTLTAKKAGVAGGRASRDGEGLRLGTWYNYTVDLSAYAGNKYIAFRHFNCNDQYIMVLDDIELTSGAKGYTAMNSGMVGDVYAFNITDIDNFDERVYFLYKLVNDNRFSVIQGEAAGMFIISANSASLDLEEAVNEFRYNNNIEFGQMDKVQAADVANAYKSNLPGGFVNSLMMDMYIQSRENNMCALADPFCTDNGMYEFPAGVNAGSGESGPDYDCLYTTPNPAWYYMRIGDPGAIDIYMYSTPAVDIDFCCWGPFDDPTTPCPNGLTEDKVVSCSYSANPTEHCMIPATAQTGEYYILVITNYSNQTCNINFSAVGGAGSTDCGILPPTDIIGFLITMDGEYLAFADPTDREYTHEGEFGDHEYCVRPIYPGEMTLPDHNYGWSMGCPVCASSNGQVTCEPGAPIHADELHGTDQIKIWWGDQNPGPGPGGCEGDTFSVDFENGMLPAGWTTIDADGDGYNWNFSSATMGTGYGHNGSSDMVFSQSYDNNFGALHPDNYLVTPAVTLCESSTFSFWACAQDASWAAEHFGVGVSEDGTNFTMVQEWTMTAKGERYSGPRGTRDQGNWYQYTVDLSAYAGEGRYIAIRHFNSTDMFYLDVDDVELAAGAKSRAEIVKYNVYRSTSATGDYALIGVVTEESAPNYYEYIDTPEAAGTYYYQVKAEYDNGCESDPAQAYDEPSHNYVSATVDAVGDNSDNVALYPNPTKGNVTIEAAGMSRITVVSVLGQVVYDTELEADTYTLNMAQFNAGMYMVRVYTESGVTVKRVTVMQ